MKPYIMNYSESIEIKDKKFNQPIESTTRTFSIESDDDD